LRNGALKYISHHQLVDPDNIPLHIQAITYQQVNRCCVLQEAVAPYAAMAQETVGPYVAKAQETAGPYVAKAQETVGPLVAQAQESAIPYVVKAKELGSSAIESSRPVIPQAANSATQAASSAYK
jgi:hypothetical protein